jgi:hypothetical protein
MAYTIVKKAYSPEPPTHRIVYPSSESRGVSVLNGKNYYVKNNNSNPTYRYVDDYETGYRSESPVIVTQRSTPRANYTIVNRSQPTTKVVYDDDNTDEYAEEDNETYYFIDGKYYKSAPTAVSAPTTSTVYVKPKQPTQQVYYVPDTRGDSDDEVYYEDVDDEPPVVQKKIIYARKPTAPKPAPQPRIVYVDEDRPPTVVESPRIYRVKSQSVIVRPNTITYEEKPKVKPLHKIIMQNRSKPRRPHRKEIEKIEIRDKPLPNRNIIHGNSIVYK